MLLRGLLRRSRCISVSEFGSFKGSIRVPLGGSIRVPLRDLEGFL